MSARPTLARGHLARPRSDGWLVAALVAAAPAVGYALARVASRFDGMAPVVMVAIPVLPIVALAMLSWPPLAAIAVFLSLPIGHEDVPGLPLQTVQVVTLVSATVVAVRRIAGNQSPLAWAPPLAWFAGLLAWMVIAMPSAANAAAAQRDVVLFAIGLVLVCLLCAVCETADTARYLLLVMVAVVALVAASTLGGAGQARARFGGSVVQGRALGAFVQPNELGTFCAVGALIAIGLVFASRSNRGRIASAAAAGVIVLGLMLSLSRGAWIGFALGVLVLVLTMPEARRAIALLALPVMVVAAAAGSFAPANPQVEVVGARLKSITGEKNPYDDRPAIWAEALDLIVADPFTGQGPGSFPTASVTVTSEARRTFAHHAHNLPLTLGAEVGLPAVVLLGGLVAHLAMGASRARRTARSAGRDRDAILISALTAAGVAILGQGVVDYTLRNAVLFMQACAVVGLLAAVVYGRREQA